MILRVQADGSYLSERNAGSRMGAIEYFGSEGDKDLPPSNGCVNVVCCRSDVVVASACEIEWAAIFKACKEAVETRQIASDLGHPQPPTLVTSDNKCAVGLFNDTFKTQALQGHRHALPLGQMPCQARSIHRTLGTWQE
jgi:hypothetical protein